MNRRIPPHNADAEASVLGAILLRNEAIDQVELRPDEFYDPRHRELFAAMRSLSVARKPIDPLTVEAELTRSDKLASVGGLTFISEVMDSVPTADNIAHYAELVADAALKRRAIVVLSEIAERGFREDVSGDELMTELVTAGARIGAARKDVAVSARDAARETLGTLSAALEAKRRGEQVSLKLQTGIAALDALLRGGISIGNTTLIAGRPSQGKSALARGIASSINLQGHGVHYFTPEDTRDALVMRQLADEADVDLAKLWSLDVGALEWSAVTSAADAIYQRGRRWLIDDSRGISIEEVAMRVRRRREENGTKLVVLDYVQIVRAPGRTPQERIAAVSEGVADIARKEGVAVLLLSQLNRESDKRDDNRPTLSDLRGAGELEQDAETVLIVHRPEHYLLQKDQDNSAVQEQLRLWRGLGEILCVKAKNGPTGRTALVWDAKSATYRDRGARR